MAVSVETVIDRVLTDLKEETGSPQFWTRAELLDYINDCLIDLAEEAWLFLTTRHIHVEDGKRRYPMQEKEIVIIRCEFDGELIDPCTSDELDEVKGTWRNDDGDPDFYFTDTVPEGYFDVYRRPDTDGEEYTLSSDYGVVTAMTRTGDTFTLSSDYGVITGISSDGDEHYTFNSDYGVVTSIVSNQDNLTIHCASYADELSDESDTLPKPLHRNFKAVREYCLHRCFDKEGEGQDQAIATMRFQKYLVERHRLSKKSRIPAKMWQLEDVTVKRGALRKPRLPSTYPRL